MEIVSKVEKLIFILIPTRLWFLQLQAGGPTAKVDGHSHLSMQYMSNMELNNALPSLNPVVTALCFESKFPVSRIG